MRTSGGITTSLLPKRLVVLSDIIACEYSVSVLVWKIFGQLFVARQRSSTPALMPVRGSKLGAQVDGDSAPGYCASVCCVPERRVGCAKRMLNGPRLEALCGIAPSNPCRRFSSSLKPSWMKVRIQRPLWDEP